MKKISVCVFVFILSFSLIGCSKKGGDLEGKEKSNLSKEVSNQTNDVDNSKDITTEQSASSTESTNETTATTDKNVDSNIGIVNDDIFGPEEDAFILYSYCHSDGKGLRGRSSATIEVTQEDSKTTYKFTEHVLSCGTHMNGTITEETDGDKLIVKASFDVTLNPYDIDGLVVEYTKDTKTEEYEGFLTENGITFDINEYYQ